MRRIALLTGLVIALAAVFVSAPAAAQDTGKSAKGRVEYSKKTIIDFNDVTLEGELTKPEGAYLLDRKKTKFSSLIKLRDNFLNELQTSVDNL